MNSEAVSDTKGVTARSPERSGSGSEAAGVGSSSSSVEETTAGGVTAGASSSEELPLDLVFTVLKNQRRRHVLEYLRDREGPVSLSDLSEYIAAEENDKTPGELYSQERKRAYVGLYQCHLPMMDDAGIVNFNKDRGYIELEDLAATFDPYLEKPTAAPTPWHTYYLSLALLGGLATTATVATVVPGGLVGGALAVAVGGVALAHGWRDGAFHRDD